MLTTLGARDVIGVDVSTDMARDAYALVAKLAPEVDVLVADGTRLPLQSRVADIGLTVTVLQHLDGESAAQVIREMCRVFTEEVVLCEDMALIRTGLRATHVLRRRQDYVRMVEEAGFQLAQAIPLRVFASEVVSTVIRGIADGRGSLIRRARVGHVDTWRTCCCL